MKSENEQWFFVQDGERVGPVDAQTLTDKIESGELPAQTQVFREGLPDWIPASEAGLTFSATPVVASAASSKTTTALVIALLLALAVGVGTAFMQHRKHETAQTELKEQLDNLELALQNKNQLYEKQISDSETRVLDGLRLKKVNDEQSEDLKHLEQQFNQLFNDHKKATGALHELQQQLDREQSARKTAEDNARTLQNKEQSAGAEALKLVREAKAQVDEMGRKVDTASKQNNQLLKQLEQN